MRGSVADAVAKKQLDLGTIFLWHFLKIWPNRNKTPYDIDRQIGEVET
jgi:hypothetical protein